MFSNKYCNYSDYDRMARLFRAKQLIFIKRNEQMLINRFNSQIK